MKQIELEPGSTIGGVVKIANPIVSKLKLEQRNRNEERSLGVALLSRTKGWISAKEFRERYMKRWKLAKLSPNSVYGWMDAGRIESEWVRGLKINPVSLNVPPPKRGRPNKKQE